MGREVNTRTRRLLGGAVAAVIVSVATLVVLGLSTSAQGGGWHPDSVKRDINVSGPFLQGKSGDPRDPAGIDRCGEPQVTQNIRRQDTVVITCMSSYGLNYQSKAPTQFLTWEYVDVTEEDIGRPCHTFISRNGGNTWKRVKPDPMMSALNNTGCGDPMADYGPRGEMYLTGNAFNWPADGDPARAYVSPPFITLPQEPVGLGFSRSLDDGRTWTDNLIPTPTDRPFLTVDHNTGVLYQVSSCGNSDPATGIGPFGCRPGGRFLVVSTDRGATWSPQVDVNNTLEPTTTRTNGRLYNIAPAQWVAAAHGVFATFGVTGTGASRVLRLQFSTDNGATFTPRDLPVAATASCATPSPSGLAADPTRPGRFAALVLCTPSARAARVFITRDSGVTWSETASLAVVPPPDYAGQPSNFGVNRPWIAYGPTGALGVMWRQNYGLANFPGAVGMNTPGPQDVFVAISRDGGTTFGNPVQVNSSSSPAPDPRQIFGDDISGLVLDNRYAKVVWGDWRSGENQTWYRRVPIPKR